RDEADRLASPPAGFGILVEAVRENGDLPALADVFTGGRKVRCTLSSQLDPDDLQPGREVLVNESMNVVAVLGHDRVGEVCHLKELMPDGARAVVSAHSDEDVVVRLADPLVEQRLRSGDSLLVDRRIHFAYERVPKLDVEDLVLEEVPDLGYDEIGGLSAQLEAIQDAVELPFLHPGVFAEHQLRPPKGVLLYGPPGCGKTMIAKAVASSLADKVKQQTGQEGRSFFINIKG